MPRYSYQDIENFVLTDVIDRWVRGQTPEQLAHLLRTHYGIKTANRQRFHDTLIPLVHKRGLLKVVARASDKLEELMATHYDKEPGRIRVVDVRGGKSRNEFIRQQVCHRDAQLTLEQIKELARRGEPIRIGIGGGETMRLYARELASLMQGEPDLPEIIFHAISSGFDVTNCRSAPISFWSYFDDVPTVVNCVGLYTPAVVETNDWKRVTSLPGAVEAFRLAGQIDIVITSLATAADEHGALNQFAKVGRKQGFKRGPLHRKKWLGDVQYYPYNHIGPIDVNAAGVRAVTLFGIRELCALARRPDKRVVVVAAPCGGCGEPKNAAVLPLLRCKELAVWTHLVMDVLTAKKLMPNDPTAQSA